MNAHDTLYLTRDRDAEGLEGFVEVWCVKPRRRRIGAAAWWVGETGTRIARYSLAEAKKRFATIPDTDIECIAYDRRKTFPKGWELP